MKIHRLFYEWFYSYTVSMNWQPVYEFSYSLQPEEPEVKESDSLGIEPEVQERFGSEHSNRLSSVLRLNSYPLFTLNN